ncbi:ribosome silencing factor [Ehrlichia ruminantium]|uniref:Ribosomal silencing factor RsfS n=1 Tax=Ehrlichia ruminantium TaxID=779 RepID=A0AAE6QBT6_EHRRU|nr:ribosome silencing factor [Ehrlichia ruminantium]QGR02715.1 ribosome silencing factor [Ehrlichia ruminantium]QGR03923.1 ribosome silencing factor [Ehrlichia ruminantium]QGR04845.1 ribosome silencing factor [Ehrlichia ruminantium]
MNSKGPKAPFSSEEELRDLIIHILDQHKADNIISINISNKSNLAKHLIIASGQSNYHVKSLTEKVRKVIKPYKKVSVEGLKEGNWVILSCYNVLAHIFRPEVREYYQLESLWNCQISDQQS